MENTDITFQEHMAIGIMSKILNMKLSTNQCYISNNAQTKSEGEIKAMHWIKAQKSLSDFRNHMEEIMFIENKNKLIDIGNSNGTDIYYGERGENIIIELKKLMGELENGE